MFERSWSAEVLAAPPLIAPARQYVWPRAIAGEEDALARGAVRVLVRPRAGGSFLLTCALGFREPSMPSGVWSCPAADWICVLAGGYAYLASTLAPEAVTLLNTRPVIALREAAEANLLLFIGFQTICAWGPEGLAWETGRLSWEGVEVTAADEAQCTGLGWDLLADEEVEFRVDLRTGEFAGGGYRKG